MLMYELWNDSVSACCPLIAGRAHANVRKILLAIYQDLMADCWQSRYPCAQDVTESARQTLKCSPRMMVSSRLASKCSCC